MLFSHTLYIIERSFENWADIMKKENGVQPEERKTESVFVNTKSSSV